MRFFDAILGRTQPKRANLDDLFALPNVSLTLQSSSTFVPTGVGGVCFREVEGRAFADAEQESRELISQDPDCEVEQVNDGYGFTWQVISDAQANISNLATNMHAINSALVNQGFDTMLLCTALYFRDAEGRSAAIVYLYKRGTFYPFVQVGPHQRDNALEIQLKGLLAGEVPLEEDLSKWSPLWDAPGMNRTTGSGGNSL